MRQKDQGWIGLLIYAASMLLPFTDKSLVFELSPEIEAVSLGAGLYFAGLACALAGLVLSSKRGTRYGGILGVLFSAYSVLFLAIINFAVILVLFGSAVLIYSSKRRRVRNDLTKVTVSLVLAVCVLSVVSFAVGDEFYVQGHSIEDDFNKVWGPISQLSFVKEFFKKNSTIQDSMKAIAEINEIRKQYGRRPIEFDIRAYNLAMARAKDMVERHYFDHVSPTGECAVTMRFDFGFGSNEYVAENCYAEYYDYNEFKGYSSGIEERAVKSWMESRGHRYNLLYPNHYAGAVACYEGVCVFLGVNNDGFSDRCTTGAEGSIFWERAPKQPYEV